jgi:hypothetical protein
MGLFRRTVRSLSFMSRLGMSYAVISYCYSNFLDYFLKILSFISDECSFHVHLMFVQSFTHESDVNDDYFVMMDCC